MENRAVRILFVVATVACFVLVFSLADKLPRQMVAAGIVLGFILAIITFFVWLFGNDKNKPKE